MMITRYISEGGCMVARNEYKICISYIIRKAL